VDDSSSTSDLRHHQAPPARKPGVHSGPAARWKKRAGTSQGCNLRRFTWQFGASPSSDRLPSRQPGDAVERVQTLAPPGWLLQAGLSSDKISTLVGLLVGSRSHAAIMYYIVSSSRWQ
jgi:hypothetical protein